MSSIKNNKSKISILKTGLKFLFIILLILAVVLSFIYYPTKQKNIKPIANNNKLVDTTAPKINPDTFTIPHKEIEPLVLPEQNDMQDFSSRSIIFEEEIIPPSNDEIFTKVEQYPSFPGGEFARLRFLQQHIKYPEDAIKENVQGKIILNFIVEKDGTVSNIKLINGIGKSCDDEALRVARLMPKWIPGKQAGNPVRVSFNMPITFKLRN